VVDDPHKPLDLSGAPESVAERLSGVAAWWSGTMASRRADAKRFASIVVMQRLCGGDLADVCLAEGTYTHVCLPMEFDPERRCATPWGRDPRTEAGELLWPARYPPEAVAALRDPITGLGPVEYSAQYQQLPMPKSGGLFDVSKLRTFDEIPSDALWLQSWDMRFIDSATRGDFVVGQVWAYRKAAFYLVDGVRGRGSFSETLSRLRALSERYPQATRKLVEDKANGPAVVNALRDEVPGLVLVNPEGGKIARANAVVPFVDAGNVSVPREAPWLREFTAEIAAFPRGRHDDQVDAATQALGFLRTNSLQRFVSAMRQVEKTL
jgi:predicted phage terminase large subunit-like protein